MIVRIALWVLMAYVITSAYEHFGHRLMMHRRMQGLGEFFEKHVLHHGRFSPWARCRTGNDPAGEWVGIDLGAPMMFFASSIIWGPVAFFSRTGAVVLAVFFSLHGEAWTWFHREIHYPRGRWFVRTAYFKFVMRYHLQHHRRQTVNYTVMCPGMDFCMGTFDGLLPAELLPAELDSRAISCAKRSRRLQELLSRDGEGDQRGRLTKAMLNPEGPE